MERPTVRFVLVMLLAAVVAPAAAGIATPPIHRGVNLTGWLQEPDVHAIVPGLYTEQDFRDIRSLGCDVVRLPINLDRIARAAPGGKIPQELFLLLDNAVTWATRSDLSLILDNHTQEDDAHIDRNLGAVLPVVWRQMAEHFRASPATVIYEIFNEPHDIPAAAWDAIQRRTLEAIRAVDTVHTVVVTGTDWGGIDGLVEVRPYADTNLLYSFHFYDPFPFTHQGAEWADQVELTRVPFPPDPARPPIVLAGTAHARLQRDADWYMKGDPVAAMKAQMDKVAAWAKRYRVPLYCGELGVYDKVSPPDDRTRWYGLVRSMLEDRGIPFTMWDYHDGFGIFVPGSPEGFEHDLNVPLLRALGLAVPAQSPWPAGPVAAGFVLYNGSPGPGVHPASYANGGRLDYQGPAAPKGAGPSITLSGSEQYAAVSFDLLPVRDLSLLARRGAAVHLWVQASGPAASFDVRFLMPWAPGTGSLPWRISRTVTREEAPWDGAWHELLLPFSSFEETGAWDGSWHDPQGLFDWSRVATLEVVAEHTDLHAKTLGVAGIEIRSPLD